MASFPYFNGTGSVYFCNVDPALLYIDLYSPFIYSLFRRLTDTNVIGTGSVKTWKTHHKMCVYTRIFYSVSASIGFEEIKPNTTKASNRGIL